MKTFYVYLGIVSGFVFSIYMVCFFASRVNAAADPALINASNELANITLQNAKESILNAQMTGILAIILLCTFVPLLIVYYVRKSTK